MRTVSNTPILHVDMDAFFVSVELLRRPELVGRPVVVGGDGPRGVVAAASYEARSFGIHSALPSVTARRLCPHAVFLPGDHARYQEVSKRVMTMFREVTPLVEPLSLDEAFLDVSGAIGLLGEPAVIAARLRSRVHDEEGLTCSVGVARTKFLAKLASEHAKPKVHRDGPRHGAGVFVVAVDDERAFLDPLPATALWGVGSATEARLARIGVETVADLAALPQTTLTATLGAAQGRHLHRLANGIDDRAVVPDQAPKSVSHEETFAVDLHDRGRLDREVVRMADAVGSRLRRNDLRGRTVVLKVRFGDFRTVTRSITFTDAEDSGHAIARAAKALLAELETGPGVRLLGVGVTQLTAETARQQTFADLVDGPWREADEAIDSIRERFGDASIGPAALVRPEGLAPKRSGDQQWGPSAVSGDDTISHGGQHRSEAAD